MDRFAAGAAAGRFRVLLVGGVRAELAHPRTPAAVREAVLPFEPTPRPAATHAGKLARIRLRAILRGEGETDRHDADAAHLADAAEAGCGWFVTHDKRILRRRDDLRRVLPGLRIATLDRFLERDADPDHPHPDEEG